MRLVPEGLAVSDAAAAAFQAAYGYEASLVATAPGRAGLLGAHTDYNQGLVLSIALGQQTAVAAQPRGDSEIRLVSDAAVGTVQAGVKDLRPSHRPGWSIRPLEVLAAFVDLHHIDLPGLDLAFASDIPLAAGMGSSSALETATAVAINRLCSLGLTPLELARVCQVAEDRVTETPTSIQDQCASLLGEPDQAVLLDLLTRTTSLVPLGLREAGLALLVIDTASVHSAAAGQFAARRVECMRAAEELGVPSLRAIGVDDLEGLRLDLDDDLFRRVRHVVTENARVHDAVELAQAGRIEEVGDLLNESWVSQRDDFEVSTPQLDLAIETALAAGAVGARPMAGTLGGSAMVMVPIGLLPRVTRSVDRAFARTAHKAPRAFRVIPSARAHITREAGVHA